MTAPTPSPWIRPWGAMTVHAPGNDDVLGAQVNIDYAVKCVNAHDDLVAALRALVEWNARLSPNSRRKVGMVSKWIEARALLRDLDASGGEEEVVIPDFGDAPVRQRGETEGYGNETDHFVFTGDEYKRQP